MCLFRRPMSLFDVTMHLNGRHPYLQGNELDFETRDVTVTVPARDWNHAEKTAMAVEIPKWWSRKVVNIKRATP